MYQKKKSIGLVFQLLATVMLLVAVGCQKDSITTPDNTEDVALIDNKDIAIITAAAVGENGGGALDQIGDLMVLASPQGYSGLSKPDNHGIIQTKTVSYDSLSKTWTVILQRERGTPSDSIYGSWKRTLTHQFRNKVGIAQKWYITKGDTAYSIAFSIISGSGKFFNPRHSHELKSISASWVATNTNTDMITVNGTFQRAAVDTLFGKQGVRISDHSINLKLNDVTGPRGSRRDLSQKVSGSITGMFKADMQLIINGKTWYRRVEREIDIQLGGGDITISIENKQYRGNPETGSLY